MGRGYRNDCFSRHSDPDHAARYDYDQGRPMSYTLTFGTVRESQRRAIYVLRIHDALLEPPEVDELKERMRESLESRGELSAAVVVVQGDTKETLRLFGDSFSVSRVRTAMFNAQISGRRSASTSAVPIPSVPGGRCSTNSTREMQARFNPEEFRTPSSRSRRSRCDSPVRSAGCDPAPVRISTWRTPDRWPTLANLAPPRSSPTRRKLSPCSP